MKKVTLFWLFRSSIIKLLISNRFPWVVMKYCLSEDLLFCSLSCTHTHTVIPMHARTHARTLRDTHTHTHIYTENTLSQIIVLSDLIILLSLFHYIYLSYSLTNTLFSLSLSLSLYKSLCKSDFLSGRQFLSLFLFLFLSLSPSFSLSLLLSLSLPLTPRISCPRVTF